MATNNIMAKFITVPFKKMENASFINISSIKQVTILIKFIQFKI